MKLILILSLCLISSFSIGQDTLTQDEIKFAARYIVYLEKKDSISQEIIKEYVIKDSLELNFRNSSTKIDSIQQLQLRTYGEILNPVSQKPKIINYIIALAIGYFLGGL